MDKGTSFQPVLTENVTDPSKVERVVLLSGKMYYDLSKQRAERKLDGRVVFVRVEVSLESKHN
jgi:probable 2-oxoglutarate dehydrogenase E1 component DHKTD1